ncbi:biopolymer transport protein ExbD [Thermostichus sp. MS-CIW-21]|jgi:biopolymer transport protein ExbD|uniref:ExbD/TolR family protein n=1 Tax=unclassified Synechococcus TaxID=2626047 RepID=UPI0000694917|nr:MULTISPECIES: biopolymer transporter ExbD [unclassified Synechococcus]ABD00918.1 proton transporter, ExbD/TolR family [Synechococcus sp. JA-3-3Ab]PIK86308.1 biopolymer transporter ExbD [Synechococcus sp. 63AY4M2]PIK89545.1 biopolymer transporter ExbD [Synechococcus sp. 65AY6A5]PIK91669.1 biopolymer transporter ExbD [Synechococcus sp. 65AY6Li]PIK95372.1 biopolymer transporter ExbD [Synechococcus sp. 60AY4M2]
MRIPEENFRSGEINIVPLIDVIFSILVFFVIASLVLTRSEALDVNLPEASTAEARRQPDVTVSITAEGQIAVNRKAIANLAALIPEVERVLAEKPAEGRRLVVINADLALSHGKVVEVMDTLQRLPNVSLAIAARRPANNR